MKHPLKWLAGAGVVVLGGMTAHALTQLPPDLPEMVLVEGGSFTMGCTAEQAQVCLSDERPVQVQLSDFWIGRYEVTNAEFAVFLNAQGNQVEAGGNWYKQDEYVLIDEVPPGRFRVREGMERHPVNNVSWYGARAYTVWLSEKTGDTYRLPTEAEWEYAARGGLQAHATLYAGGDDLGAVAWHSDIVANSGTGWGFRNDNGTHPVGSKAANALGLHDMSGNLFEWTGDLYHNVLPGGENPTGAEYSSWYVQRGGSWDNDGDDHRVTARSREPGVSRWGPNDGFRVVREVQP